MHGHLNVKKVSSHLQQAAAGLGGNDARCPLGVRLSGHLDLLDAVRRVRNMRETKCSGLPFHNLFTIFIKLFMLKFTCIWCSNCSCIFNVL